jgi:hypothetical protein
VGGTVVWHADVGFSKKINFLIDMGSFYIQTINNISSIS